MLIKITLHSIWKADRHFTEPFQERDFNLGTEGFFREKPLSNQKLEKPLTEEAIF